MLFRFALLFLLLGCGPNSEKEACLQVSDWQQNLDSLSKPVLEQISVAIQEKDSLALESGISVLQNVLKQAKASAQSAGCMQPDSLSPLLTMQIHAYDSLAHVWLPEIKPLLSIHLSLAEQKHITQRLHGMQQAAQRLRNRSEQLLLH
jgi:hypothetical protein